MRHWRTSVKVSSWKPSFVGSKRFMNIWILALKDVLYIGVSMKDYKISVLGKSMTFIKRIGRFGTNVLSMGRIRVEGLF